jgi:hypothetical protein
MQSPVSDPDDGVEQPPLSGDVVIVLEHLQKVLYIRSPRLKNREQAPDFLKRVVFTTRSIVHSDMSVPDKT